LHCVNKIKCHLKSKHINNSYGTVGRIFIWKMKGISGYLPGWIDDILLFGQGRQGLADQAGLGYPQGFASLL
jgi:hypothetical protein